MDVSQPAVEGLDVLCLLGLSASPCDASCGQAYSLYEPALGHLVAALLTNTAHTLGVQVDEEERVWLLQGSVAHPDALHAFLQYFKDQATAGLHHAPGTLVALKALSTVTGTLVSPALADAVCSLLDAPALNGPPRKLSGSHVRATLPVRHGVGVGTGRACGECAMHRGHCSVDCSLFVLLAPSHSSVSPSVQAWHATIVAASVLTRHLYVTSEFNNPDSTPTYYFPDAHVSSAIGGCMGRLMGYANASLTQDAIVQEQRAAEEARATQMWEDMPVYRQRAHLMEAAQTAGLAPSMHVRAHAACARWPGDHCLRLCSWVRWVSGVACGGGVVCLVFVEAEWW